MAGPSAGVRGERRAEELSRAQAALARRVAEARATVPDLTLETEVEVSGGRGGEHVLDRVLVALAAALRAHPRANGGYRDGAWALGDRVNLALAVEHEDSFVLPVLRDADALEPAELAGRRAALVQRARAGGLTAPELAGATFTVWPAEPGVHRLVPVPVPGQAGALGLGAPRAAPVVRGGEVQAGELVALTLVTDHRILFGAAAAAFLADVAAGLSVS